MIVPLTLADFLERAEHVYGDREAIVDEPNPTARMMSSSGVPRPPISGLDGFGSTSPSGVAAWAPTWSELRPIRATPDA